VALKRFARFPDRAPRDEALKRGRKVAARVTITATDKAGNREIAKRRVKLKL